MTDGPYIAEAASLIGDPARANILVALLDGRALTATELGLAAGVAPSTTSGHLAKLLEGRLVSVTSSGRHRYFRLGSPAVARVLESLAEFAVDGRGPVTTIWPESSALRWPTAWPSGITFSSATRAGC